MHLAVPRRITAAAATNAGTVRQRNEDAYTVDTVRNILMVADGMGGHRDGDVASKTALAVVQERLIASAVKEDQTAEVVRDAVSGALALAHERVQSLNAGRHGRDCMGTTIVGFVRASTSPMAVMFHAGDSRMYRRRASSRECLTSDHTAYQRWLDSGSIGIKPNRHVITQALGASCTFEPSLSTVELHQDDLMLLCSDGLSDVLTANDIAILLEPLGRDQLGLGCEMLVQAALDAGSKDNVTALLAWI